MNRFAVMAALLISPVLGGSSRSGIPEPEECCCQVENAEAGRSCCDEGAPREHSCKDDCSCSSCGPTHCGSGHGSIAVLGLTHPVTLPPAAGARAMPGDAMLSRNPDSRIYRPPRPA